MTFLGESPLIPSSHHFFFPSFSFFLTAYKLGDYYQFQKEVLQREATTLQVKDDNYIAVGDPDQSPLPLLGQ